MTDDDTPKKPPAKKAVKKAAARKTAAKKAPAKRAARKTSKAVAVPEVSIRQVVIGNRTYPLVFDPACAVCRHVKRALIEEQILLGTRFTAIASEYSNRTFITPDKRELQMPELTAEQISKHFRSDHSPIDAFTLGDLADQVVDTDEYPEVGKRVLDGLSFANGIIGRVQERVVRGEVSPTIKDGLTAARIDVAVKLAQLQTTESQNDASELAADYEMSIEQFFTEAGKIFTPVQQAEFVSALRNNPILLRIYEKQEQQQKALSA